MRLSAGAHLGTYTVLAPLGAGGMGEVYRARDRKLDRDVAIKVLSASLAHDPGMLVRFEREAKALAALSHGASVYCALKTNEPGGGAGPLYRVPTLGGAPRELLTGIDSVVSFSPDGSRISYVRVEFPARGESSVMIASADGSGARALATRKSPQAFAPGFFLSTAWSPDGTRVYAPLRDLGKLLMRIVALDAATGEE